LSNADFDRLLALVARLRAPDGCPWDQAQGLGDALDGVVAADGPAARTAAWAELEKELGDVLFQAAFIGRLAEESAAFTTAEAIHHVEEKMIARHPHVFGEERLADAAAVQQAWERRKLLAEPARESLLAGVSRSAPALLAAYRLTQKAAGVGFDWDDAQEVLVKIDEEIAELREALGAKPAPTQEVREELGDVLFTVANLARKLDLDPEAALAQANRKFRTRFGEIERALAARGQRLDTASRDELERLWEAAKRNTGR
jgi:ATP diphosphatase